MIGTVYPSEKFQFTDAHTGAKITQYTSVGSINRSLYFTSRPYLPGSDTLIFLSNRTGRNEVFMVERKSGKIVQLSDHPKQPNVSICVNPAKPEVYFSNKRSMHRVRFDPLRVEELVQAPDGFIFDIPNMTVSPWLVFGCIEQLPGATVRRDGKRVPSAKGNFELHYQHPRALIYRYNVDTDVLECIWGQTKMLSHVQMSPTDPNLIIFSGWVGYGEARVQRLDVSAEWMKRPKPLLPESENARGGHETFTRRGNLYLQWMDGDLRPGKPKTLYHGFLKLAGIPYDRLEEAKFEKYVIPENRDWMGDHFTMSEDETWGVHDRWVGAPTDVEDQQFLTLFRHQAGEPQTVLEKLCFQDAYHGDVIKLGPNVTLDEKDELATYTSFLKGQANLCQVDVRPVRDRVLKARR